MYDMCMLEAILCALMYVRVCMSHTPSLVVFVHVFVCEFAESDDCAQIATDSCNRVTDVNMYTYTHTFIA